MRMMMKATKKPVLIAQDEQGSTLLEILVSVLVISIALLGAGVLQSKALKSSMDGYWVSKAGFLVDDLAERIRTNHSSGDPANVSYNFISTLSDYGSLPASSKSISCVGATTCTPADIAVYDVAQWLYDVSDPDRGLPSGAAKLVWSGKEATITVRWLPGFAGEGNCDASGDLDGAERNYRCLQMVVVVP
jgi:type IV pilus assembly protein PilV